MKTMPVYIVMSLLGTLPQAAFAQDNCLFAPQKAICKTENLNLYVGPQSVEPGEDIFIAIETLTGTLESSTAQSVTIIDADSGQHYQTEVVQGLAYIELKAPARSGRLVFTAQVGEVKSGPAEVLVHAAKANTFALFIEKNKGEVFVSSSIIADRFGNIVDDGQNVAIELVAGSGVYSSMQTETRNGRIGIHVSCGAFIHSNSRVRARIGQTISEISLPAFLCGEA